MMTNIYPFGKMQLILLRLCPITLQLTQILAKPWTGTKLQQLPAETPISRIFINFGWFVEIYGCFFVQPENRKSEIYDLTFDKYCGFFS